MRYTVFLFMVKAVIVILLLIVLFLFVLYSLPGLKVILNIVIL